MKNRHWLRIFKKFYQQFQDGNLQKKEQKERGLNAEM